MFARERVAAWARRTTSTLEAALRSRTTLILVAILNMLSGIFMWLSHVPVLGFLGMAYGGFLLYTVRRK